MLLVTDRRPVVPLPLAHEGAVEARDEGVVADLLQGPFQHIQQIEGRDLDDLLDALRPRHSAGPDDLLPTDALARDKSVH